MLSFQFLSLILTLFPPCMEFLVMGVGWVWHKLFPSPGDKFARVVEEVMRKDERILSRKFADRWLLK